MLVRPGQSLWWTCPKLARDDARSGRLEFVGDPYEEFRDFVLRGNVVDLAVAFVIGAAFAAVVTSFVSDILTPLLGLIGVPDFREASVTVGAAEVRYGVFLNALIAFLLVAAAIFFFVVKPMSALAARRKEMNQTSRLRRNVPSASPASRPVPAGVRSAPLPKGDGSRAPAASSLPTPH